MTVAESPEVIVEVAAEVEVVAAWEIETPVAVEATLAGRAEEVLLLLYSSSKS